MLNKAIAAWLARTGTPRGDLFITSKVRTVIVIIIIIITVIIITIIVMIIILIVINTDSNTYSSPARFGSGG